MASFTINSKLRMNSGFDIPLLGYGVGALLRWKFHVLIMSRYIRRMHTQTQHLQEHMLMVLEVQQMFVKKSSRIPSRLAIVT
jgi:hypothetical protein